MKMKLLAPAGDMESLKMAVYNGADEVYLGVKDFNARNIEGFSLESLKLAVDFAHLYSVKVFLAVNILFSDAEMQSAVDLIVEAFNLGVDAFIIQDVGLASLIHTHYPVIELHASTQMGIHNLEGVRFVESMGFKRVVLARETPLEEVKRIRQNSKIELEYFCQGALCVAFSGNCYMSSYMCNASGNRGKCKQLCRLSYELLHDNQSVKSGYLLSAKDFNMLNRLKDLEEAGIDSIKIEGRARRPYYVAVATKTYRNALDGIEESNELELAFNRGYAEGYFNGNSGIISNLQNHIGIEIGVVQKVNYGKKFNEIFLSSKREISSKSTLKFFRNGKEVATISAFDVSESNGLIKVTTTQKVKQGDRVNLISDFELEQQMMKKIKKLEINIHITAKVWQRLKAVCNIGGKTFEILGETLQSAKSAPLTLQTLENSFKRSDIFAPKLTCEIDNVFLATSQLNEFRRQLYNTVKSELTKMDKPKLSKIVLGDLPPVSPLEAVQFVGKNFKNLTGRIVVYDPEEYGEKDIIAKKNLVESLNKEFVLNLPNFALKEDIQLLKNLVEKNNITIMAQNTYALCFDTKKYIGAGMNVYNGYSAKYFGREFMFAERGEKCMPYMTLRHCPLKEHLGANCANCQFDDKYLYKMENGTVFKLKRKKLSTCTFYLVDRQFD